jgi:hypothetical protein
MKKVLLQPVNAMAFYHPEGLVSAWNDTHKFIGSDGRIGTMADVVDARINTGINDFPWNTYFTTTSAEYFGYSRGGTRILIVAHGIGPMSTLDGILKAYSFEYKDTSRTNRGGRITFEEFRKLEDGCYGDVSIVDFDSICHRYEYPFSEYLMSGAAKLEPLILARLGPRAIEYLEHHERMAKTYHNQEHGINIESPFIVEMSNASNCPYQVGGFAKYPLIYPHLDQGNGAIAHLLSTGRLGNVHHQSIFRVPSLANDISCHEWSNGTRLLGIRGPAHVTSVHEGPDNVRQLLLTHWQELLLETNIAPDTQLGFRQLMQLSDGAWFTQVEKKGACMDTFEPEYPVVAVEPVGGCVKFTTTIGGYHGFFKYGIEEVEKIKPKDANAYTIEGGVEIIYAGGNPTHHQVNVQFYRTDVDVTQRLISEKKLRKNFNLLLKLMGVSL